MPKFVHNAYIIHIFHYSQCNFYLAKMHYGNKSKENGWNLGNIFPCGNSDAVSIGGVVIGGVVIGGVVIGGAVIGGAVIGRQRCVSRGWPDSHSLSLLSPKKVSKERRPQTSPFGCPFVWDKKWEDARTRFASEASNKRAF